MKATTDKRIDLSTLMAHLGTDRLMVSGDPDSSGSKEVEADIPDLAERLASYVYAEPPEQVAETSITGEAAAALVSLRTIANGTNALTLLQLTPIVRGMARVLIVLVRLQLRRFDGTE
jgi:hypothetical protein